jgi:uncharacterized protein (DUF924 family)
MATPSPDALAVLTFWFDPAHRDKWWATDPSFDALIRERFAAVVDAATGDRLAEWSNTPSGWLALLIVLDQFPRNLHRRDARAWRHDRRAQQLAAWGIDEGYDLQLPAIQRVFAYMPLEHAEDAGMQDRCVALFEALCADLPPEERDHYRGFLNYARRHQAVIARFGRFPHRNALLGRADTPEEAAYLAEPGAGF